MGWWLFRRFRYFVALPQWDTDQSHIVELIAAKYLAISFKKLLFIYIFKINGRFEDTVKCRNCGKSGGAKLHLGREMGRKVHSVPGLTDARGGRLLENEITFLCDPFNNRKWTTACPSKNINISSVIRQLMYAAPTLAFLLALRAAIVR